MNKITLVGLILLSVLEKGVSQNLIDSETGTIANVSLEYGLNKLSYCNFYKFRIFENTRLKDTVLQIFKNELTSKGIFREDSAAVKKHVEIKAILSFTWHEIPVTSISYNEIGSNNVILNKFYSTNQSIAIIESVKHVLSLSNDAFWQFYNKENNQVYPEINALKPQVQDANGVLNIEKLAAIIEANKTQLAKYLDE